METSRRLTLLAALPLVAGLVALPAGAQPEDDPNYDLDRVRAAQSSATQEVGPPPAELSELLSEYPTHLAHAQQDEYDLPRMLHATVEDLPALQEQMRSYLARRYRAQSAATRTAGVPQVFKVPVLMFGIHGDEWQSGSTAGNFENLLSGTGTSETGSVTELYREMSFGAMEVDFDVFGPYDSVVSNAPGNQCFYGTDGSPVTGDQLGLGGGGARGMAAEAVPMADPDVNFGDYDNDLDGVVDFLIILHSGPDAAATGNPCHVWSHYFGPLNDDPKEPTMLTTDTNADGTPVYVSPAMTIPEVDLQIGVTAHELMHALGEPDYYGTAGTAGTGDWDLGAGGSWLGIPAQTNSVHFNPVMKLNFGWVRPHRIDETALDQRLRPRASHPDLLQVPVKVAEPGSEEAALCDRAPVGIPGQNNNFYDAEGNCLVEGFLIENVSGVSARFDDNVCTIAPADFDRQVYGSGLMVWHWDFTNYQQLGNNVVMRPMLDVEEFDRRDSLQEMTSDVTRAEPTDVFWGDPVGISSATQVAPGGPGGAPEPRSWTVSSPPTLGATHAEPAPEWEAADVPPGTAMVVDLTWDVPTDDWDLFVDKMIGGEWVEVGPSAGGAPQTSEQVVVSDFKPGDRFRARAENWLAPTSPQAEVTVSYDTKAPTLFGPAGTRNADLEVTGWSFTDIGPHDYRGVAHAANQPRSEITLDLIKHDDTTVDVSGDFVRAAQESPAPVVAGRQLTLETVAYNHGGAPVQGVTVALYDGDPAAGGTLLARQAVDLGSYARVPVRFDGVTLDNGLNELYVKATAPTDVVDLAPGNDVVRTELRASAGGADVLIVDHDRGWTREQAYEATLNALGVSYDIVTGEPGADVLTQYDAAIWTTTTVSGGQGVLSSAGREALTSYLDNGGKVWMATTRLGAYADPAWLASYFGFAPDNNLLNSMGEIRGVGDDIGDTRSIAVNYLDGRPYWDFGRVATDGVKGLARTLFVHSERPEDAVSTKVIGDGGFRTVYGLPLAIVEDGRERVALTSEVLDFFGIARGEAAADDLQVRFERFQHVQPGQDWPVTIGAVGPKAIDKVELVHRPYGAAQWRTVELTEVLGGVYTGVIPGEAIGNNGLEYFARVTTGRKVAEVDGGSSLPDIASAPYGDPVDDNYCQPADDGSGPDKGNGKGGRAIDSSPSGQRFPTARERG